MKKILFLLITIFICMFLFSCNKEEEPTHTHTFEEGICIECGYECEHEVVVNGTCEICGETITKHRHHYLRGKCIECGYECPHDITKCGQMCSICGYVREHD